MSSFPRHRVTVHEYDVRNTKTKQSFIDQLRTWNLKNICTGNVCNTNCTAVYIPLNQTAEEGEKGGLFYVLARTYITECALYR